MSSDEGQVLVWDLARKGSASSRVPLLLHLPPLMEPLHLGMLLQGLPLLVLVSMGVVVMMPREFRDLLLGESTSLQTSRVVVHRGHSRSQEAEEQ